MLDTDICIYVIKNRPAELRSIFNEHVEQLCVSSVTLAKLIFDAEKSSGVANNLEAVENFRARLSVLPFDKKAEAHYGELRATLERAGMPTPLGGYDPGYQQLA